MKTNLNKLIQASLIGSTLLFSACAKRVNYDSSSSRADAASITTPFAACSQGVDKKNGTTLSMTLKALKKSDGSYLNDWTALVIENVPDNFKTNNQYIQFWKWKASSDNTTLLDSSVPQTFYVLRADTLQYISSGLTQLNWEDLQQLLIQNNLSASTLKEAFQQVRFTVSVQDITWDVLRLNLYDSQTNVAQSQVDALIPIFAANPNEYKYLPTDENQGSSTTLRPQVLLQLHPFYSLMNNSWTSSDYQNQAQNLCNKF